MNIPDDLVPLADVAAKFPRKTVRDLRRLSRAKKFPDIIMLGRAAFVRQADLDLWQRGAWQSGRAALAEATFRHALPPMHSRRAKGAMSAGARR